jgi:DNA repair protein RecO (recombination protein O)
MAIEKSEALVLRVIPFRDTSKILTVYTAEHGVVSLLAKGVRSARPRFGAALELFASIDVVYYQKDSRELQLLSQATLLDPHLGLCDDSERYAFGVAVLEFLLKVLAGQEPPGRLYPLSQRTLEVLEEGNRGALLAVFRAYELKAVSFLGHRPELYACVECQGSVEDGVGIGFSALLGGVLCPDCTAGVPGAMDLSGPTLGRLRRLLTATLADIAEAPPEPAETAAVGRVMEPFLQAHLERYEQLRALRLAQSLGRGAGVR